MKIHQPNQPEPFDPMLSPLLDEALKPVAPPGDLAERIIGATRLPLARAAARPAILAYLGPRSLFSSVAAAVVCAALLGVGMVTGGILRDASDAVRGNAALVALSGYRAPSSTIDSDLRSLNSSVDVAGASVERAVASASADPAGVTWPEPKAASQPGLSF